MIKFKHIHFKVNVGGGGGETDKEWHKTDNIIETLRN